MARGLADNAAPVVVSTMSEQRKLQVALNRQTAGLPLAAWQRKVLKDHGRLGKGK